MVTTASSNGNFPQDARSAAELYLQKRLAPIPLPPRSKDPGYHGWQQLRLTPDTLDDHFPPQEVRNIGVLNGEPSGNVLDVDLDCPQALLATPQLLPDTGWIFGRTSAPSSHRVYRADRCLAAAQEKYTDLDGTVLVELRGTGGMTVYPPSLHMDTGEQITWERFTEPAQVTLVELQQAVREVAAVSLLARHWPAKGTRQDTFLALAGGLLRAGWAQDRTERFVEALAAATRDEEPRKRVQVVALTAGKQEQDRKTSGWPKLEELIGPTGKDVVRRVRHWLAIAKPKAAQSAGRPSAASRLVQLVRKAGVQLFHADDERTFALIPSGRHRETWPLRSQRFRSWLSRLFYQAQKKTPGSQALADALNVLEGLALHDGPALPTYLRVAGVDGKIYLDLADAEWRAVEIDAAGWRVVPEPPVRFRRPKGMRPLPEPVRGGSLEELQPLVNVRDEANWLLLVGWLAGALRDRGPYPVLALAGEQGTAKTTLGRLMRRLLDPSVTMLRSDPRDTRDLMIAAHNGWLVGYDNLSDLPGWLSDALCRLATGGGFGTRQLYTDEEEALFDAVRPVLLTSITDVVTAPDLLDRCLFLRLAPIGEKDRLTEEELDTRFNGVWPRVLGALCEAISVGLRLRPGLRPERLPRMADFALFAEAVCRGLGHPPGSFLDALAANRHDADAVALETFLVVPTLRRLLEAQGEFTGTATELLAALKGVADETTLKQRGWPSRPNHLSNQMRRLAPNLRRSGIAVDLDRAAHGGRKLIHLALSAQEQRDKSSTSSTPSTPEQPPAAPGVDGVDQSDHLRTCSSPVNLLEVGAAYLVVTDRAGLDVAAATLDNTKRIGLDLETTGLNPRADRVRLLSLAAETLDGGRFAYLVDCFAVDPSSLWDALAGKELVIHNAAFDLPFLARLGFTPAGTVRDTMLLAQLLTAGTNERVTLAACCQRWLNRPLDKAEQKSDWSGELTDAQLAYAASDVEVLAPLLKALAVKIEEAGLVEAAKIEQRCLPAVVWMGSRGVALDRDAWQSLAHAAVEDADCLREELYQIAPPRPTNELFSESWNWDSTQQARQALALAGCPVDNTADDTLAAVDHPLAQLLRRYRLARKRGSTYGTDWLAHVADDGRVYPSWRQIGSRAGRMSCRDPNMQQLPRGDYRRCVVAPPGRVLVKADYSQIELRIAAKVSGDKALLEAYQRGDDLHTRTARTVLGVEEVTKQHRQLAKALNFGLVYGMGARGFRQYAKSQYGLDLNEEQAIQYRNAFFTTYPGLAAWHRRVGRSGKQVLETRTLTGRRRLEVNRFTEKLNTPVQGSGADGLKLALALLWERREQAPGAFPVLAVHDEIVVEADAEKADAITAWLKTAMVDAMAPLINPVPVEVEVKVARTWGGD
jgi:DNA polymerase I-like protein with 3'-5' exonuclease and polymerase domains